jgi:predicted aspartyl protease
MKFCFMAIAFFCMACVGRADEPCSSTIVFSKGVTSEKLRGVSIQGASVFVSVQVIAKKDELRFLFDTGAGRTVIDRNIAARLGLRPTEKSSIGGVGTGRTAADVVKGVSLQLGQIRVDGVDLYVTDIPETEHVDGIIGYDLLCASVVTLDYKEPSIVVTLPSAFQYHGGGDKLPLEIRGRWPYVPGTLKVAGVDAVTDEFLLDTGSDDAVNHPIIRQSKGPLRETTTGNGGFGKSQPGVIGPNEWFRIGSTTIPSTVSACCAASEEVSRQLGSGILSRFRITFDYPGRSIFLEKYSDHQPSHWTETTWIGIAASISTATRPHRLI